MTISEFAKVLFTSDGRKVKDPTASNNRIASGFFPRLNVQRCAYSLGNGVTFTRTEKRTAEDGAEITVDLTKEQLGTRFDTDLYQAAYKALIHGVCYGFWNADRLHAFPVTEFAPLPDERTGALRAGVRYYRIDKDKPMTAMLYEADGYTRYESKDGSSDLREAEAKRSYREIIKAAPADAAPEVVSGENYGGALPIVPLWGSRLHQSTLIGMREAIDSYDLIRSGFADDLSDCAQI